MFSCLLPFVSFPSNPTVVCPGSPSLRFLLSCIVLILLVFFRGSFFGPLRLPPRSGCSSRRRRPFFCLVSPPCRAIVVRFLGISLWVTLTFGSPPPPLSVIFFDRRLPLKKTYFLRCFFLFRGKAQQTCVVSRAFI